MPVAACQPLLPSALRPNSNTSGIADGSIIAAIITTQLAVNDSKEPRPIPMSPLDRDSRTTSAHAIAATIRKASAAKAGGASSTSPPRCSPAPANRNRQAGQNPRRLVGLISPVADSVRLSDINQDTRPVGGGIPGESPTHTLLVGGQLGVRRYRHSGHRDVAVVQVNRDAFEVVQPERARVAGRVGRPCCVRPRSLRIEHCVVDDELAPPLKDLAERLPTVLPFERILILDQLPRQFATLLAELIAKPSKLLFLRQMLLSGSHAFVVRHYLVGRHKILLALCRPRSRLQ